MLKLEKFDLPTEGEQITIKDGKLQVPNHPIIPFIEGDGTGRDIWKASKRVLDAAVTKAYGGTKQIAWYEVFAGEKAFNTYGEWLPNDTLEAIREYFVAIKGPLTTPIGGGIRSLNVALRQELDLYVCLRPVRYFEGFLLLLNVLSWWIWLFSVRIRRIFMQGLNIKKVLLK